MMLITHSSSTATLCALIHQHSWELRRCNELFHVVSFVGKNTREHGVLHIIQSPYKILREQLQFWDSHHHSAEHKAEPAHHERRLVPRCVVVQESRERSTYERASSQRHQHNAVRPRVVVPVSGVNDSAKVFREDGAVRGHAEADGGGKDAGEHVACCEGKAKA